MPPIKTLMVNDGHEIGIPAKAWPWVMEWTWTYEPHLGQIIRIENGRTILLYHELVKHGVACNPSNIIALNQEAIDNQFITHPAYNTLIDEYQKRLVLPAKGKPYVLPNPYQFVGISLTYILDLYFKWLGSGKSAMLDLHAEAPKFVMEKREDPSPYYMAEEYPRLGDWMYQEWSGVVNTHTTPPTPTTYIELTSNIVINTMELLIEEINPNVDRNEIFDYFEEENASLVHLAELVHLMIEAYPTPVR